MTMSKALLQHARTLDTLAGAWLGALLSAIPAVLCVLVAPVHVWHSQHCRREQSYIRNVLKRRKVCTAYYAGVHPISHHVSGAFCTAPWRPLSCV